MPRSKNPFFVGPLILAAVMGRPVSAQTVNTIYSFDGSNGYNPYLVTLTQGRGGRLYGTSPESRDTNGNVTSLGTVFRENLSGDQNELVYRIESVGDGNTPMGGLLLAGDGNLYGTTLFGGALDFGVLYRLTSSGVATVVHSFGGGSDGLYPFGPPIQASDGNLYGITQGTATQNGTIYKLTLGGVFETIYTFAHPTPAQTEGGLIQGADGGLYINQTIGGTSSLGSIVKVSPAGRLIYERDFGGESAVGLGPVGVLMQAGDGNLYGTNRAYAHGGGGTIFRMTPRGVFTVLHKFDSTNGDGRNPRGGLVEATDGKLYGVTCQGGSFDAGSFYEISLTGAYQQIYSFPGSVNGPSCPEGSLMQSSNGTLYGTTLYGGPAGVGSIFSIDLGLAPFVALLRAQGTVGSTVGILGQGFKGAISVTFNGVPTTFNVLEDTYISALVPSGAGTGPVVVTVQSETLTSNRNFTQK